MQVALRRRDHEIARLGAQLETHADMQSEVLAQRADSQDTVILQARGSDFDDIVIAHAIADLQLTGRFGATLQTRAELLDSGNLVSGPC